MAQIQIRIGDADKQGPAEGVFVKVSRRVEGQWEELGSKFSGKDGLSGPLLPTGLPLHHGVYRLRLETGAYFRKEKKQGFFSHIDVHFILKDETLTLAVEVSPESYTVKHLG